MTYEIKYSLGTLAFSDLICTFMGPSEAKEVFDKARSRGLDEKQCFNEIMLTFDNCTFQREKDILTITFNEVNDWLMFKLKHCEILPSDDLIQESLASTE